MAGDREINVKDMFDRILVFNGVNASDYVAYPLAATNFAIVQTASDAFENYFATQTSGDASMAVDQKSLLKAAVIRRTKEYSKTARGLKASIPGIEQVFKAADHRNEATLIARGREIVIAAATYKTELESRAMPPTRADELTDILNDIETAIAAKSGGKLTTVGATAGIDEEIAEGMEAATIVDSILLNVYRDNPVKLAEWKTARHIKRAPRKAKTLPPPTP